MGSRLIGPAGTGRSGWLWSPPRLRLDPQRWTGYQFWDAGGRSHTGRIAALDPCPAYAGISPWEQRGDTVSALDAQRPALIIQSADATHLDAALRDANSSHPCPAGDRQVWPSCTSTMPPAGVRPRCSFSGISRTAVLLYCGYAPADAAGEPLWAYLAALPSGGGERDGGTGCRVGPRRGEASGRIPEHRAVGSQQLADGVARLSAGTAAGETRGRYQPGGRLYDQRNDGVRGRAACSAQSRLGPVDPRLVQVARSAAGFPVGTDPAAGPQLGGLFGGGITCSALYDDENGISRQQLLDMATRGPAGQLMDAWETPGIRHGSLSSPAYRDYLLGWCRQQIDAGVDYLFMDEHTAALGGLEGYDDHSLADFRQYLSAACPQTQGWQTGDPVDERLWN